MTKQYLVYTSEAEAVKAEVEICIGLNLPQYSVNAFTGETRTDVMQTTAWATPRQRADGKWVIPKPDYPMFADTEDYDEKWFPEASAEAPEEKRKAAPEEKEKI